MLALAVSVEPDAKSVLSSSVKPVPDGTVVPAAVSDGNRSAAVPDT